MPNGYIDLPLSTRLLGQQVEYSQDSDIISVADFSATTGELVIDGIDITGFGEESSGYVTTLTSIITIQKPRVAEIDNDERLDYGDQIFNLYKVGTETAVFTSTTPVEIILQDFDWAETDTTYEAKWDTYDDASTPNKYENAFEFTIKSADELPQVKIKLAPFVAKIDRVENDQLHLNISWDDFRNKLTYLEDSNYNALPTQKFQNWGISYKINDKRDLYTYLHLGDDKLSLITNIKSDYQTFPEVPHSSVLKLYEPLPEDFEEKDNVFVVREIMPQKTEVVELVPYDQEDEDVLILKVPDSANVDSPISNRSTELQSYDDLLTTDGKLKKKIIDKYVSGSDTPVDLNIDYSNYENFINFSSAEKRL